jgi:hypothetical protein
MKDASDARSIFRWRSNVIAGVVSLAALSLMTCDLFGPEDTYTLVKVNGQPLPAIYLQDGVVDGSVLEGSMLRGKLEFLGNHLYRMTYLHRTFNYEGTHVIRDTTWTWTWQGPYYWTDSTLVLYACSPSCLAKGHNTLRLQGDRKVLLGAEDVPVHMGVEWVQR